MDVYLTGDTIQCLICERWFRSLGRHLRIAHGTSADGYRALFTIPAGTALAGRNTREMLSAQAKQMHANGTLDGQHLLQASAAAVQAGRGERVVWERAEQSTRAATVRPGDTRLIPVGQARADGRDATRARAYQQARRALLAGDPEPMRRYREDHE